MQTYGFIKDVVYFVNVFMFDRKIIVVKRVDKQKD